MDLTVLSLSVKVLPEFEFSLRDYRFGGVSFSSDVKRP